MAAKYMVTVPPGAPIPNVGFIRPGETFVAPGANYIPSRTFRPLNREAVDALGKVFDGIEALLKQRQLVLSDSDDDMMTRTILNKQLRDLPAERAAAIVMFSPTDTPDEPVGIALSSLARPETPGLNTPSPGKVNETPSEPPISRTRASDQ